MPTVHHVRLRHAGARHHRGSEQSPVLVALVLIATIGVLAYAAFLLNPANRGDFIPYVMVLSAELVLVFHALVTMATILAGGQDPRTFAVHQARASLYSHTTGIDPTAWPVTLDGKLVTVDVLITVYGEPVEVVERTARAALAIRGRHRTWILDDGDSDDMRDMAARIGARYIRRLGSQGAKAGNVNHALTLAKGEYFVIFDADFVPRPEFIEQTLPFFVDDKLAFVQTPQSYGNAAQSVIAKGASYMQTVFYRFVQPGKNRFNAAFCVGTNVMFRRTAVLDVGGICTDSKSEDVWTSLMMHERGWRSIFIPEVLAVGDAPESVEAFSKQQLRWATGGFEILFSHPLLSRRKSNLTLDQRIQYLTTASFYLTGIAPLPLLLVPPLEIFFDLRPVSLSISPLEWAVYYAGFYAMQVILVWFTLGTYRWETLTLATVSFPIYTKALFNVLRGKEVGWQATGTLKKNSPFNFMIPQLLMLVFLAIASVVAVIRDWGNGFLTLATVWNVTNTVILTAFVYAAATENRPLKVRTRKKAEKPEEGADFDAALDRLLTEESERLSGPLASAVRIGSATTIASTQIAVDAPVGAGAPTRGSAAAGSKAAGSTSDRPDADGASPAAEPAPALPSSVAPASVLRAPAVAAATAVPAGSLAPTATLAPEKPTAPPTPAAAPTATPRRRATDLPAGETSTATPRRRATDFPAGGPTTGTGPGENPGDATSAARSAAEDTPAPKAKTKTEAKAKSESKSKSASRSTSAPKAKNSSKSADKAKGKTKVGSKAKSETKAKDADKAKSTSKAKDAPKTKQAAKGSGKGKAKTKAAGNGKSKDAGKAKGKAAASKKKGKR